MELAARARARGVVTFTLADYSGRVVERRTVHNATIDAYMQRISPILAGAFPVGFVPTLTHFGVGDAGVMICPFETVASWTGTPVLDTTSFRQGAASFTRVTAAGTEARMVSPALGPLNLSTAGSVEVSVKVNIRSRLNATTEVLRFTTSVGNRYALTWAQLEVYAGTLVDNTWTRALIPKSAFTETGTPSWASIDTMDWVLTANANGILTGWIDDLRIVPTSWAVTPATAAIDNEIAKGVLTSVVDLGGGVTRVQVFWTTSQIVGTHRLFGLYGNAGAELAAVVALDTPLYKSNLLTLTVEWDVAIIGS